MSRKPTGGIRSGDLDAVEAVGVDQPIGRATEEERRRAQVAVADHIAAQHQLVTDVHQPQLAGRLLAHDPAIAASVLELLAALGLLPTTHRPHPEATP